MEHKAEHITQDLIKYNGEYYLAERHPDGNHCHLCDIKDTGACPDAPCSWWRRDTKDNVIFLNKKNIEEYCVETTTTN